VASFCFPYNIDFTTIYAIKSIGSETKFCIGYLVQFSVPCYTLLFLKFEIIFKKEKSSLLKGHREEWLSGTVWV
jgi:hypothetical protein